MKSRPPTRKSSGSPPDFFSLRVAEARRFYLDLNPPAVSPIAVVSGGCEHCAPDYSIQRASFPYYGVEFVARGKGTVRLGRREYPLHPGRLFSYGPGVRQHITTDPRQPLVKYFVDFSGRRALELLRSCRLPPGRALQVFAPGEVQLVFDEIIRNGQRNTRASATICAKLLECLFLKIEESRMTLAGGESLALASYLKCREHIQQHFIERRTLAEVARGCNLNASHLCRLFQRFDHQTPYQYLMRLKMNRAAEQLHQTGALVKQVAEAVGFSDPFQFSRGFKRVFGLSPDHFRRLR
jgi:AraC-like DNA-binding protein